MHRFWSTAILLLIPWSFAAAQYLAIVKDKDGYVNVREGRGTDTKVVGRILEGDAFLYLEPEKSEWYEIFYSTGKDHITGYIHKSRVVPINQLPRVRDRKVSSNQVVIVNDSISFSISKTAFDAKNHKIGKTNSSFVSTIDGVRPSGVDGGLPKFEIKEFVLEINGRQITIPKQAYSDLFEPNFEYLNVCFFKDRMYIYMPLNSDGAGGYEAVWIFRNGQYLKRYVDKL
ncbi:MAG: SH3 domain-containing protein [Cytophagales bacterium]|nr:SH3 domain-containing protein [Cytophagales bacterium]